MKLQRAPLSIALGLALFASASTGNAANLNILKTLSGIFSGNPSSNVQMDQSFKALDVSALGAKSQASLAVIPKVGAIRASALAAKPNLGGFSPKLVISRAFSGAKNLFKGMRGRVMGLAAAGGLIAAVSGCGGSGSSSSGGVICDYEYNIYNASGGDREIYVDGEYAGYLLPGQSLFWCTYRSSIIVDTYDYWGVWADTFTAFGILFDTVYVDAYKTEVPAEASAETPAGG